MGVVGGSSFSRLATISRSFVLNKMSQQLNQRIDGPAFTAVKNKLVSNLIGLQSLEIYNDSYKHVGHSGVAASPNKNESHLRLEIVSDSFEGLTLPSRHRMIYKLINDEITKYGIHSIQLKTKTASEQSR
ncbi:hypothetical protein KAFR_0K00440 [Kazachstania africana CBS 2517]|uniref:BolA protein n=1 Tax=Kazachstania africana (strain ATCC 22294 / BCRC 22015 / CBS 2517 / CECT 1963 / NBRC 1671 / NRRL Y-8276) TaxID=1071382 RepID=H2B199_KAZAF|nr:hypothetical protein KAFR_0K00440 [Kazachstania africana CBS 2517]CCF60399.1 hypothetical protein KAFR_0K00440 [Kazachstania africana CBS 2517]